MRPMTFIRVILAAGAIAALSIGCESTTSTGAAGNGDIGPVGESGGFLWKPVSDGNGRLAIVLPPMYTGNISLVYVAHPDGTQMEGGNFSSVGNGGRETWRFSKPGGAYPGGSHAVAMLKTGSSVHWTVANTGARTTY